MIDYDFKPTDQKLAAAKEWLAKEYRGVRSGRATPAILDGLQVSAYGSLMPLKQVASITVEDARTLRVSAFDASIIKDIERAIASGNLGVGTTSDGTSVRVSFPELSAERRDQLTKLAKQKLEEARTSVRQARDEAWKEIQEREREGTLTEDDKFTLKDDLQKRVDTTNDDLESMFDAKETELRG